MSESIRAGAISFEGGAWSGVTSEAKELCQRLLERDASKRIDTK